MKTAEDAEDAEGNVAIVVWIYIVDCRFLIVDLDPRCGIQQSTIKDQQFGGLNREPADNRLSQLLTGSVLAA